MKLNDALDYAADGWWIVPFSLPPDEQPLVPLEKASRDPNQIRAWWQRWPNANVGCPHAKNNLMLIEVKGEIPEEIAKRFPFSPTRMASVSDIKRYYYRMKKPIKSQRLEIADGVWVQIYGSDTAHALPAYQPKN
jgi:bifunctional DNA primase/polymerase-like protein